MTNAKYIGKKIKLKTIIKNDTLFKTINETVLNYNQATSLAYQLIKSYWLYKYNIDPNISINIDKSFIKLCFSLVSVKDNRGNKNKTNIIKDVQNYYNNHFIKTIKDIKFKNLKKTSFIKDKKVESMLTSIENNIKNHFDNRLFKYLKSVFLNDTITDKSTVKKELNILKRDLILNKCTQDKYKDWFENNRNKLLPSENYYEILNLKPNKLLNYMFYMNNEIEKKGHKTFHCLPLGNNIPNYITINTCVLIDLIGGTKFKEIELQKIIWDEHFKTNKKIFKNNKSVIIGKNKYTYKFNGVIMTDGIGATILFELLDENGKGVKSKKIEKEFKEFNELTENEIKILKKEKKVYIDPGKRNIICCIDDNDNRYIYKNGRRINELKTKRKNKIIKKEKIKHKIRETEYELNNYNSKTCNYNKFIEYITVKNKLSSKIFKFYEMELFRNMKFRSFTLKQKSESNVVNEMNKKYGSNITLMYGDKNIGKEIKGFISTPMIGFKRMLNKKFKIIDVDEFRTTKLDYKTTDNNLMLCENGKTKRNKKIHGVLVSKILKEGSMNKSYNNRDINGCKNIRKIVLYGLLNKLERPKWYRRNIKLPSEKQFIV